MTPRVLLCGRPDLLSKPGGDTRQILTLQRSLGPRARLCLDLDPPTRGVELVHVFNLSRPVEPYLQARVARRAGLPVVCTPIFQDLHAYNRRGRHGVGKQVFAALGRRDDRLEDARALVNLRRSGARALLRRPRLSAGLLAHALTGGGGVSATRLQRWLVRHASALVVGAPEEARTLARRLGITLAPGQVAVVPVGVDPRELGHPDPRPFVRRHHLRDFVLCVGRIEDLKNQLALVEALRNLPLPLVLVGGVNPAHRGYARAVRRALARTSRSVHVGGLQRPMLLSAMAAAAVHVLPSWVETTGLVSLEAAACDCAVVSTSHGYARATLGDDAQYCDPGDPVTITRAVERALERGPSLALKQRVMTQFTVDRAGRNVAEVYERVLARHRR